MEKGYIILAHRNAEQLYRLLNRLDDNRSTFFIHIDKKVPIEAFSGLAAMGDKVQFVKRVVSNWAEFGLVQATINALQAIKDSGRDFHRIILLSGQDYPIKTNELLDEFFTNSSHSIFIESVIIPDFKRWKPGGGRYRINKYFFGLTTFQRYTAKVINFLGIILPVLRRKPPRKYIPYAGSQWWIIDMYGMHYILNYLSKNKAYCAFHQYTFAPDEVFFHGILLNTDDPQLRERICNDNKRFMNWEDTSKGHPETLLVSDLPDILKSEALFARKFDQSVDQVIFDMIDEQCLNSKPGLVPATIGPL